MSDEKIDPQVEAGGDFAVGADKAHVDLESAVRRAEQAGVEPATEATDVVLLEQHSAHKTDDEPLDGFGPADTQNEDVVT